MYCTCGKHLTYERYKTINKSGTTIREQLKCYTCGNTFKLKNCLGVTYRGTKIKLRK